MIIKHLHSQSAAPMLAGARPGSALSGTCEETRAHCRHLRSQHCCDRRGSPHLRYSDVHSCNPAFLHAFPYFSVMTHCEQSSSSTSEAQMSAAEAEQRLKQVLATSYVHCFFKDHFSYFQLWLGTAGGWRGAAFIGHYVQQRRIARCEHKLWL